MQLFDVTKRANNTHTHTHTTRARIRKKGWGLFTCKRELTYFNIYTPRTNLMKTFCLIKVFIFTFVDSENVILLILRQLTKKREKARQKHEKNKWEGQHARTHSVSMLRPQILD